MTDHNAQSTQSPPWHRKVLYGITNWALLLAGLANLGVGTLAAFNESAAVAATSLTAGLVLLFAATIDRFESLNGIASVFRTLSIDGMMISEVCDAKEAIQR